VPYRVFFVEDEIAIREGIRDNVDWNAHGFEFCGEAPDGEMALPLLYAAKPDVLITDIRMPFMDGLQLSQIVRDRLPATKIIILSGHDEFEYAQKAIKLGVFEYLLKPVSVQDLHLALQKAAAELDQERGEQQALQKLRDQVEENRAALRERLLLRLVTGDASPAEAIEKSQLLGIDLVAKSYLVVGLRIEPFDRSEPFDLEKLERTQQLAALLVENNPDAFLLRKDLHELVLLLKGSSPENLYEERDLLLERMRQAVSGAQCELLAGSGTVQKRITEICQSFLDAEDSLEDAARGSISAGGAGYGADETSLLDVDKSAVEDYLRSGTTEEFDDFFEAFSRPLGETVLKSPVAKSYIFTDVVLASARFVDELGGNVDRVVPELGKIETVLAGIATIEQLREHVRSILAAALAFRDNLVVHQYAGIIKQAQEYMERSYADSDLSLNDVAGRVSLSACHFSTLFSQETGQTYKEYLTEIRIKKAKELLRTTTLKGSEICYQVGYKDPHYFSHVFHKNTGLTPMEFRLQVQAV
jgi:two-component system response regulator YesN